MNISKKWLRDIELGLWGLIVSTGIALAVCVPACTTQQAQTAANVVVRIAQDVCTEESPDKQPADPAWVALVCKVVSAVSGLADSNAQTVHVQIPRVEWVSLKAATAPKSSAP
jgi:hypothetical protein